MSALLQKFLLTQDPEWSHDFTLRWLNHTQNSFLSQFYQQTIPNKPVTQFGLTFKNPVGLAAGLDKNGDCIQAFGKMGFGFIEIGTITPKPQPGNDKPRIFRLPEAKAIINRMGFNNKGVDHLVEQVKQSEYDGILGINIGKNKVTPEEKALDDYLICLRKVYAHADYVTINISSPNTPGLRNLQYGEALDSLLDGLMKEQKRLTDLEGKRVPILVKIAPDLTDEEIEGIARSFLKAKVDGVIATNTTLDREPVSGLQHASEAGGLSGSVLTLKSQHVCEKLNTYLDGEIPMIGVGGIDSVQSAKQRLNSGASLIQLYSAFIYQGPKLVKQIVEAL